MIDDLEKLAKSATPGPWWIDSHGHTMISEAGEHKIVFTTDSRMGPAVRHEGTGNLSHWRNDFDASYIAAANPSTILELIAAYRQAVSAIEIVQNEIDPPTWISNGVLDSVLATAKRLGI